jgi:hypothetical protein
MQLLGAREASLPQRHANDKLSLQSRPSDFGPTLGSLRLSQSVIVERIDSPLGAPGRLPYRFRTAAINPAQPTRLIHCHI